MLVKARATTSLYRQCLWRYASTQHQAGTGQQPALADGTPTPVQVVRRRQTRKFRVENDTIRVRPWDTISTMPEMLAIIRGVESKFGRFRDYALTREYELPDSYSTFFFAAFASAESLHSIPASGVTIQVPIPRYDFNQPGGPGLDDIVPYLKTQTPEKTLQLPGFSSLAGDLENNHKFKMVEVRIDHATNNLKPRFDPSRYVQTGSYGWSMKKKTAYGLAFANWGGFYTDPDTKSGTPLMERAIRRWADIGGFDPTSTLKKRGDVPHNKITFGPKKEEEPVPSPPAQKTEEEITPPPPQVEEPIEASISTSSTTDSPAPPPPTQKQKPEIKWEPLPPIPRTLPKPSAPAPSPRKQPQTASQPKPPKQNKRHPNSTRRQLTLQQAAEISRAALPTQAEQEEARRRVEEEKQRKVDEKKSMSDRLWTLMGGKWW
ncbi:hypothetical protein JAAARDRAFT_48959 [Jaapia argillacea MUCL 33604]|uniref:Uncharacterized protein n=1 Tax=Jaapia argillacea MUCL 33604 TaxID=933084 RepID=A0A067PY41_9AGAM|nr:hypothetical protein JAAARDRAFT_48959 [Jaapia argillacea MUCL 33604]